MIDLNSFKVNAVGGPGGDGPGGDVSEAGQNTAGNQAAQAGFGHAGLIGQGVSSTGLSGDPSGGSPTADPAAVTVGESHADSIASIQSQQKAAKTVFGLLSQGLLGFDMTGLMGDQTAGEIGQGLVGDQGDSGFSGGVDSDANQFGPGDYNKGNRRTHSAVSPTLNQIPTQAAAIAKKDNDTTLNPEEAAAEAKTEERKKARQRVGLMQMRAVDPLFMEGLPDIFRPRAK